MLYRERGYFGLISLKEGVDFHVVLLEAGADVIERFVYAVSKLKHFVFLFVDGSPVHHGLPIKNLVPVSAAVNEDYVVLGELACLHQREHFPKLVHGAESSRENDQGFGDLREP